MAGMCDRRPLFSLSSFSLFSSLLIFLTVCFRFGLGRLSCYEHIFGFSTGFLLSRCPVLNPYYIRSIFSRAPPAGLFSYVLFSSSFTLVQLVYLIFSVIKSCVQSRILVPNLNILSTKKSGSIDPKDSCPTVQVQYRIKLSPPSAVELRRGEGIVVGKLYFSFFTSLIDP